MFLKKVECTGIIERGYRPTLTHLGRKRWSRLARIFTGHVIGERTLSEGYTENNGPGEGVLYTPDRYFKAYLVVFNIHRKPVYVLPEDVKIIDN